MMSFRGPVQMKHVSDFVRTTGARWLGPLWVLLLLSQGALIFFATWGERSSLALGLALGVGGAGLLGTVALVYGIIRMALRIEAAHADDAVASTCLREAIDAIPAGLAIYDDQDRLIIYNREASRMHPDHDDASMIGQTYETMIRGVLQKGRIPAAVGQEDEWLAQRLAGRGKLDAPLLQRTDDGRWVHFYEIRTPSGYLTAVRLDVTPLIEKNLELEHANEKLARLSTTDGLTGVANRRLFDQSLKTEWQRSARNQAPLSLLMIDIDYFKRYNDQYGHLMGDECLRQVACILYDCAQRSGEMVARYGGEEFALLLPGVDVEEAKVVAQRCMDELLNAKIAHANSTVSPWLTFSIGVATTVADQKVLPETLVKRADVALYCAKSAGRTCFEVVEP